MAGQHGNIWRKRVLLPLLIVQLIALVVFLGLSALGLWAWRRASDDIADDYPGLSDNLNDVDDAVEYVAEVPPYKRDVY